MKISMLITNFNRALQMERNINRMMKISQFKKPDEIVVVDDGSVDNTVDVMKSLIQKYPEIEFKYFYRDSRGYGNSGIPKNIGLKGCTGDLIFYSEPEMLQVIPALPMLLKDLEENPKQIATAGSIFFMRFPNLPPEFYEEANPEKEEYKNSFKHEVGWVAAYMFLCPRKVLMDLGGWREDFIGWGYDDTDILTRLRVTGWNQFIDKKLDVIHQWHPWPPINEMVHRNEAIFLDAKYDTNIDRCVVNKDKEWGMLGKDDLVLTQSRRKIMGLET